MRIFLTLAASPNPALASSIWKSNLHDPLVSMGHDVLLYEKGVSELSYMDPDAPATAGPRARFMEEWTRAVEAANRAAPLDLVLTYVGDSHLDPSAVRAVRERIAPCVNFFCNNIHQFHLVRRVAPAFDLCLVPEKEAIAHYDRVGAEALYWPMAANPDVYRPIERLKQYDATFAGQRYGDRTALMLSLRESGVDAHAFGQGWTAGAGDASVAEGGPGRGVFADAKKLALDTAHGRLPWRGIADRLAWRRLASLHAGALHAPLSDSEYVALFSESRISLGFLVLGDTHRTLHPLRQVRLREFEATMAGSFYLTGWIEELEELYIVGREIECYRSRAELVDKARFYLRDEEARERVRRAGHERARRDHTWQRRFEALFAEMKRRGLARRG